MRAVICYAVAPVGRRIAPLMQLLNLLVPSP